ncbi:MAG: UvrD-helicase domain-containing protein [Sphaerochaeta sp.]
MIRFEEFLKQTNAILDENQKKAVNVLNNCVVCAGAGSGKTTVLSYRFLRLVLERKARCDEILTLTFTRKAAREMHQRIHKHLLSCIQDEEIAQQLEIFSEAAISTLDSFCATIVRSNSISYGVPQDFVIDDEKNLGSIRRIATELLDAYPQSPGAKLLSELYSPDTLIDNVFVPLASTYYCLPKSVEQGGAERILKAVEQEYEHLLVQYRQMLDLYASFTAKGNTVQGYKSDAQLMLCKMDACESKEELRSLLCSDFAHRRAPGAGKAEDIQTIKDTVARYRELRSKLCMALSIMLAKDQLHAVLAFMQEFVSRYQREKRSSGILTFGDVSTLAVAMLVEDKSLRAFYKKKFRYIMIDEFQDNNAQQKALLYLLAERLDREGDGVPLPKDLQKDKLFFVGDEKQSIYRFRGSDVRVFKQLSGELASIGGETITLGRNYRSEPDLISLFNRMFPSIMQNNGEHYEADFSTLEFRNASSGVHSSCTLLIKPYQEGGGDEEEEEASSVEAEAYAIAKLVKKMLESDEFLIPSQEGPRRPMASDIALLLRTTSNQLSFEKAFRRFDVPYTVQAARSLMLEAPANDLYAMLQLTLYPEDRQAYATVLRSPFCNLSDWAITHVIQEPLFSQLSILSEDDAERLAACGAFYRDLVQAVGSESLSTLSLMLWYESGYYLSLVSNPQYQVYVEHFAFFHRLAQIQERQGKSISQFVDFLRRNLVQNEKIDQLEVIKEQESGLQIMSIHKSKGLEFPIVIVGNAASKAKGGGDYLSTFLDIPLPHYLSASYHVTATKQEKVRHAGMLFGGSEEQDMEIAELKRLLYVAMTRAESHLVISGAFSKNNRGLDSSKKADTLLQMLVESLSLDRDNPVYDEGILKVRPIESIPEHYLYSGEREDNASVLSRLQTAECWYEQATPAYMGQAIRVAVTKLHPIVYGKEGFQLPRYPSDEILGEYSEEQVSGFGTFVHGLCEQMVQGNEIPEISSLMPTSLTRGMKAQELAVLAQDARTLCKGFLESEWYKREVKPYPLECEVGFFSAIEQEGRTVVAEGSIDLLVKQNDAYLVIDFKTDRWRDETVHRFQIETYMQAVQRIHDRPVKGCVVYLRDPDQVLIWEGENQ